MYVSHKNNGCVDSLTKKLLMDSRLESDCRNRPALPQDPNGHHSSYSLLGYTCLSKDAPSSTPHSI